MDNLQPFFEWLSKELTPTAAINLAPVIIYFSTLILSIFRGTEVSLRNLFAHPTNPLHLALSVLSFYLAWFHILSWMLPSSADLANFALEEWAVTNDAFNEAYRLVTGSVEQWWWSSQLLLWTVPVIVWMWSEGVSHAGTKGFMKRMDYASTLVYVWLGFFGAMSVGFSLFALQQNVADGAAIVIDRARKPSFTISVAAATAALSILLTPYISPSSPLFVSSLVILHVALLLPITGVSLFATPPPRRRSVSIRKEPRSLVILYALLAGINFVSYLHLTLQYFFTTPIESLKLSPDLSERAWNLWNTPNINHCQASISGDLVFATITSVIVMGSEVFKRRNPRKKNGESLVKQVVTAAVWIVATPVFSVSVTFPLFMAWRETWRAHVAWMSDEPPKREDVSSADVQKSVEE
ncbi:hypothetical protein BJ742DRAFT_854301 [Cladochytrium replicatum]|nr:hypothetical protein BJ742DRAFT_854301 [Cladochytrium replicatum]